MPIQSTSFIFDGDQPVTLTATQGAAPRTLTLPALSGDAWLQVAMKTSMKPLSPALNAGYTSPSASQVLSTNLKASYLFYEGTSTLLHDSGASGLNLTTSGTPTWTLDANLNYTPNLLFGTSKYATLNTAVFNWQKTQAWSVCVFVKSSSSAYQLIVGNNQPVSLGATGWNVNYNLSKFSMVLEVGANYWEYATNSTFADGNWHRVIFTYDGNYASPTFAIYVDNAVAQACTRAGSGVASGDINAGNYFYIGSRGGGSDGWLIGNIAYCAIWSRVLQAAEIADLMANPYQMESAYANTVSPIGGSTTQVQYNNNGIMGGDSTFTFNAATKVLTSQTHALKASGATYALTLASASPAAARTYTFQDAGADANVVLSQGAQTLAGALTLTANLTLTAVNLATDTTTGMKIGTATGQKIAFWNKTPIVQPTTGITGAAFVAGSGTAVNDASTFGGYTIKQIAAALVNTGLLA